MYDINCEMEFLQSKYQSTSSGIPSEFKGIILTTPYPTQKRASKLLLALADQLIKTGLAIKNNQVKLNKQEIY